MSLARPSLIEFPADDPERALRFWGSVLGVELEPRREGEGEGWQTRAGDPAVGVHARGQGPGDTVSLSYLEVDDMEAAVERVTANGGSVVHPGEVWTICRDSEGSPFALARTSEVAVDSPAPAATSRGGFSDEEWARLGRAPLLAGVAISLADPGGPFEALKESRAALSAVIEAAGESSFGEFVRSIARDVAAKAQRRENPLAGFRADGRNTPNAILDELRAVYGLLVEKAAEDDVADFREWVRTASQRAALAAKEGGFMGIGGKLVSDREQEMLETLGEVFGVPRSPG
jgi:predicted enzyme related to lactoylglutathione lyase